MNFASMQDIYLARKVLPLASIMHCNKLEPTAKLKTCLHDRPQNEIFTWLFFPSLYKPTMKKKDFDQ